MRKPLKLDIPILGEIFLRQWSATKNSAALPTSQNIMKSTFLQRYKCFDISNFIINFFLFSSNFDFIFYFVST